MLIPPRISMQADIRNTRTAEARALQLFPEEQFTLIDYTPRREDTIGRKCENAKYPDFRFRDKQSGKEFWVECKYRSHTESGKIKYCEKWKLESYRKIRKETDMKFFFIVGLGGTPAEPESMYCMDMDRTDWGTPFKSSCSENEITPGYFSALFRDFGL